MSRRLRSRAPTSVYPASLHPPHAEAGHPSWPCNPCCTAAHISLRAWQSHASCVPYLWHHMKGDDYSRSMSKSNAKRHTCICMALPCGQKFVSLLAIGSMNPGIELLFTLMASPLQRHQRTSGPNSPAAAQATPPQRRPARAPKRMPCRHLHACSSTLGLAALQRQAAPGRAHHKTPSHR